MNYLLKIENGKNVLYYYDVATWDTDKNHAKQFTDLEEALQMASLYQQTCSYPVTIEEIEAEVV